MSDTGQLTGEQEDNYVVYDGEALLAAFKELLGDLYIDAGRLEFISELGVGELALVERGLYHLPGAGRVRRRQQRAKPRGRALQLRREGGGDNVAPGG
jgi:hypothetical protein